MAGLSDVRVRYANGVIARYSDVEAAFSGADRHVERRPDAAPFVVETATWKKVDRPDDRCTYTFPLPDWMGPDQDDRCRCDLGVGHTIPHSCSHLRGEKTEAI